MRIKASEKSSTKVKGQFMADLFVADHFLPLLFRNNLLQIDVCTDCNCEMTKGSSKKKQTYMLTAVFFFMVTVLSYILSELVAAVSRCTTSVWYTLDETKQTPNHPSIQWAMQRRPL